MTQYKAVLLLAWLLCVSPVRGFAQDGGLFCEQTSLAGLAASKQPTRFFWRNQPLSDGLASLEEAYQISIWLDRQIDPSTRVSYRDDPASSRVTSSSAMTPSRVTLINAISEAVLPIGAEASLIENVIYIGPRGKGARLQRAAHELANDTKLLRVKPMKWQELADYNSVAKDAIRLTGLRVRGGLPHDLMHARQLKRPLTVATQLSLLAVGFDLEFRSRGRTLEIIPLGTDTNIEHAYQSDQLHTTSTSEMLETAQALGVKDSQTIQKQGSRFLISGPATLHLALLALDSAANRPISAGGKKVLSFSVEGQEANRIITSLAIQVGFRVEWDPACPDSVRNKRIDLYFKQTTLEEVLQKFAAELDINHSFFEGVVRFSPK